VGVGGIVCMKVVDMFKADLKSEKKEKASNEEVEKMITKSCKKVKDSNKEDRFVSNIQISIFTSPSISILA
jgi:hypothetical protein